MNLTFDLLYLFRFTVSVSAQKPEGATELGQLTSPGFGSLSYLRVTCDVRWRIPAQRLINGYVQLNPVQ